MQPIFSRNDDINKMAFLNWRMEGDTKIRYWLNLAEGYMNSSIILAKQCLIFNRNKQADILIFPIFTNANHGLELYLKSLNWMLNKILKSNSKIEGNHNIQQIFRIVKSKIKILGGTSELKSFESEMVELDSYINELFEKIKATSKDDRMDFSRYPFSNKYENHFYVDGIGNVEVDLENFVKRFEIINEKLESISDHFYDMLPHEDFD
jgi:hypothetical protein